MKKICQIVLVLIILGIGTAAAQDHYLALGDSIPFGYNPFVPLTTPNLLRYYHGYPQYVAGLLSLELANASCPGQTSSSFLGLLPDNGCDLWRLSGLPLFVAYTSSFETQLQYATAFLAAHPDMRLVTITIGGDDLLYLAKTTCSELESCITADLPGVLAAYKANLTETYTAIRGTGYEGPIVAVNYPSPDYSNAFLTEGLSELNLVTLEVTQAFNGKVADAFSVFKVASIVSGGLPCFVGLLFFNPLGPGCDVHPTPLGQLLMAQRVLHAMGQAGDWFTFSEEHGGISPFAELGLNQNLH